MKKINVKLLSFFIVSLLVFSNQVIFAGIIIRKDDPAPGTQPNNILSASATVSAKSYSLRAQSYISVSADVVGSELYVDFSTTVGTAFVSVVDQNGSVVYQTVVDTYSTSEVVIPVDGLASGQYAVKISYGSTHLIGNFQL